MSGEANSPTEEATARYMMNAWASFARDPANGLRAFGWPVYDPQGRCGGFRLNAALLFLVMHLVEVDADVLCSTRRYAGSTGL